MSHETPGNFGNLPLDTGDMGMPAYGAAGPSPAAHERRTQLRDPELSRMPLGDVVDRLTTPESIEAQIVEYVDTLRHTDPDSLDAKAIRDDGELMSTAPTKQGRRLYVGSAGDPEIDLVRRGLEDAPRSDAGSFGYDILRRVKLPDAAVLVRGEVSARTSDFVLPKGGFNDRDMADGYNELRELAAAGREPSIHATAIVTPDGSVMYVYRDGNVSLRAVANLSQPVRVSRVEVVKADPSELIHRQHQADYEAKMAQIEAHEAMPGDHYPRG